MITKRFSIYEQELGHTPDLYNNPPVMGAAPSEVFNNRGGVPTINGGGVSPVPPVPPVPPTPSIPYNEIWYTTVDGKIWDWQGIVDTFVPQGATILSPKLLSNEWDETDNVYKMVFDGNIDAVGVDDIETMTVHVFFATNPDLGVECNVDTIILPNSVVEINSFCFADNANLVSVDLGNSVTSIREEAFSGCGGLTSIEIPNSVTSIGNGAFWGCESLPVIDNIRYADTYLVMAVPQTLATYTIKEGTRFIGEEAFLSNTSLTSITIPNSVTSIGGSAFASCSSLISIEIPNSVSVIGVSAFYGCSGLTSVTIGNSVTSIGNYAFRNCTGLNSVTIPNSVTSIGNEAFAGCSGLTSVTIGNSVSVIGEGAFNQCAGLTSIIIPESVTSIGYEALGCSTTTDIYFKSLTPVPLVDGEGNIIEMCHDGSSDPSCVNAIYVPESVVDTYKTFDDGWEIYADKIQGYTPE